MKVCPVQKHHLLSWRLQAGLLEQLTGNWLFHNFSTPYFGDGKPVTPAEVIPRVSCTADLSILASLVAHRQERSLLRAM